MRTFIKSEISFNDHSVEYAEIEKYRRADSINLFFTFGAALNFPKEIISRCG